MRGTRLWQAPGSPIIQGRSKSDTPFAADLVRAMLATGAVAVLYHVLMSPPAGGAIAATGALAWTALIGGCVGLVPAVVALGVARAARSRRAWLVSGAVGAVVAVLFLRYGMRLL